VLLVEIVTGVLANQRMQLPLFAFNSTQITRQPKRRPSTSSRSQGQSITRLTSMWHEVRSDGRYRKFKERRRTPRSLFLADLSILPQDARATAQHSTQGLKVPITPIVVLSHTIQCIMSPHHVGCLHHTIMFPFVSAGVLLEAPGILLFELDSSSASDYLLYCSASERPVGKGQLKFAATCCSSGKRN